MTGKPELTVVEVDFGNLRDVPVLLRALAEQIESGEVDLVRGAACFVGSQGDLTTFGWGDLSDMEAIGLLTAGAAQLAACRVQR